MECTLCKGRMVRETAPFSIDRKGYQVAWESFPAWVCTQCGESCFEAREVESIQALENTGSTLTQLRKLG